MQLDFDSARKINASLGSGAVLVLDETHNMAEFVRGTAHFFAHESCGKCAPCREGTARVAQLMDQICEGKNVDKNIELIKKLHRVMGNACFCPLGQGACNPIISALNIFPEDFEACKNRKEA